MFPVKLNPQERYIIITLGVGSNLQGNTCSSVLYQIAKLISYRPDSQGNSYFHDSTLSGPSLCVGCHEVFFWRFYCFSRGFLTLKATMFCGSEWFN